MDDKSLEICSLVLNRGCFFYEKLLAEYMKEFDLQSNDVCIMAYYIRSLAEISTAMHLWFASDDNIEALASAAFIDFSNLLIKKMKRKKNMGTELSDYEKKILDASKGYEALYYKTGETTTCKHRKQDKLYVDTLAMTSKLIHQDEFSILGMHIDSLFSDEFKLIGGCIYEIAPFWLCDYENAVYIMSCNQPSILSFYEKNFSKLPFSLDQWFYDKGKFKRKSG